MALVTMKQDVIVGEQVYRTRSCKVASTFTVTKGMVLEYVTATTVKPAEPNTQVVAGIALYDAIAGEDVTFVLPPCDVRVMVTESQNIAVGDRLQPASIVISAVTTNGHVAESTDPTFSSTVTQAEGQALLAYMKKTIGFALEALTTSADEAKVLKMRFYGQV